MVLTPDRKKSQWDSGFYAGVITVLTIMHYDDPSITPLYEEVARACGYEELIALAKRDGNYADSGLKKYAQQRREREKKSRSVSQRGRA